MCRQDNLSDKCSACLSRGYKDGLQPMTLADGNWLVKQNQPVSKIETKSDTNFQLVKVSKGDQANSKAINWNQIV